MEAVAPSIFGCYRIGMTALSQRAIPFALAATAILAPFPAHAAPALDGAAMGWPYALPFAGILLSIAAGPLLFAHFWHAHYGKIAAAWALVTLAAVGARFGIGAALASFVHALLAEYMSFIILLFALYTVAGGLLIASIICLPSLYIFACLFNRK